MGCGYSKLVSLEAGQHKKGIILVFKVIANLRKHPKNVQMQEFQTLG